MKQIYIWVCEFKASNGKWFAMPEWGAGSNLQKTKNNVLSVAKKWKLLGKNWALTEDKKSLSDRIRFRKYAPFKS